MQIKEILQALPSLRISDHLKIAESALQLVLQEKYSLTKDEQKRQLTLAAIRPAI
ncbi:hypothetical protein IQ277_10275 [Nostocales cyanobacterium LEGE 12452]|nr:hypothetical protein [Nostocales cyanobacterium LEGE 12452]